MRILFDSKQQEYKDPFGTLTPDQPCRIQIRIPNSVPVTKVQCIVQRENGEAYQEFPLERRAKEGVYSLFGGTMVLSEPGLYFYYFYVGKPEGGFRLFKQGDDTNMEAGDLWQVSCIPEDFTTPDWIGSASPAAPTLPANWSRISCTRTGTRMCTGSRTRTARC